MERLRLDDDAAIFVYTGQENVPDGVIRVRVHPSIKVIHARAFFRQRRLIGVELHDGIEVIEDQNLKNAGHFAKCCSPHPSGRSRIGHSVGAGG